MLTELAQKIVRSCMRLFCIFPIKKNRIIFNSQKGRQYACSPRAIFEYLEGKYGKQLEYVWCLQNPPESFPQKPNVVTVSYNSLQYFYYQMTSKVIVANIPSPCYVPKRKQQFMIDTWHGGGAYKRVGISVPKQDSLSGSSQSVISGADVSDNARWELYKAHYNAKDTSLFLSSSKMFTEVMYDSQMIPRDQYYEVGMPRNDIFFKDYKSVGDKARKKLGIGNGKKVILFAPTYRGNVKHQQNDLNLDIQMCLDAAKKRWGGEWVFVYRMHIFSNSLDREKIPASAIDASKYDEMQELLCMADVFITDYSSSQWDFSLTKKPAFLFTPDLDYYLNEDRGFYTPVDDWAFPYAKTNEELADLIRSYSEELHLKKVQRHLDLLGSFEDGHATEKVCDVIIKQIS
jgi:CDP-glycerol glycerophosphotransferase